MRPRLSNRQGSFAQQDVSATRDSRCVGAYADPFPVAVPVRIVSRICSLLCSHSRPLFSHQQIRRRIRTGRAAVLREIDSIRRRFRCRLEVHAPAGRHRLPAGTGVAFSADRDEMSPVRDRSSS